MPVAVFLFFNLFIFGCIGSFLPCVGFIQLRQAWATLHWGARASRCGGFSLQSMGSRHAGFSSCGSRALECRLSSCGARAQLLHSMWDLPGLGIEPVSPALAGRFLSTAPPGKPASSCFSKVVQFFLASGNFLFQKPRGTLLPCCFCHKLQLVYSSLIDICNSVCPGCRSRGI